MLPDLGLLATLPGGSRLAGRILSTRLTRVVPITIEHRYDFGPDRDAVGAGLDAPEAWDALRSTQSVFGIPDDPSAWAESVARAEFAERARSIHHAARRLSAATVCSYGVGGAGVEHRLALEAPELELLCTEFAPRTVERLQRLFPSARIVRHDLRHDAPLDADLHLLHRVDTEFTRDEWRRILARFTRPVLLVVSGYLDRSAFLQERALRRDGQATRAGWVRNEAAIRALWAGLHTAEQVPIGELSGFLLRPGRR